MKNAKDTIMILLVLVVPAVLITAVGIAADGPLDAHEWEQRVLIHFAPGPEFADVERQQQVWQAHVPEMKDRDLVTYYVYAGSHLEASMGPEGPMAPADALSLREEYDAPEADADMDRYLVVLIGKDGAVKERWTEVVDASEVFELIDTMPMRQREMAE